jgi:CubicO group peptidase (beta-lactamase class C family)
MPEIVTPEEVGMSSNCLRTLDETMQAFAGMNKVAGLATLVARLGRVVHHRCYGKLNLEVDRPVQPTSIFRLTSLTKPITAVAALMLHEKGCFDLHDPVARWIPEFKNLKVYKRADSTGFEYINLSQ